VSQEEAEARLIRQYDHHDRLDDTWLAAPRAAGPFYQIVFNIWSKFRLKPRLIRSLLQSGPNSPPAPGDILHIAGLDGLARRSDKGTVICRGGRCRTRPTNEESGIGGRIPAEHFIELQREECLKSGAVWSRL
jgi:hypothetical protein